MSDDFGDLLRAMVDGGVRFLVVGAHALAAHGVPRMTGDLDLWIERSPDNASRTWGALGRFGAPLDVIDVRESDFLLPDRVIQIGVPPFRIDVLTSISGVEFAEAWPDRIEGVLFGVAVTFIGREAFVRNKRASGRPKDLEDVRALGISTRKDRST